MFLTPSAPNLEGLDIDDDNATKDTSLDDAENSANDETGHASSIFTGHSIGSTMTPELEASRQLLIENLIGMVLSLSCFLLLLEAPFLTLSVLGVPSRLGTSSS
jgi:hypothetical protein